LAGGAAGWLFGREVDRKAAANCQIAAESYKGCGAGDSISLASSGTPRGWLGDSSRRNRRADLTASLRVMRPPTLPTSTALPGSYCPTPGRHPDDGAVTSLPPGRQ
jgi:hypothetical protein